MKCTEVRVWIHYFPAEIFSTSNYHQWHVDDMLPTWIYAINAPLCDTTQGLISQPETDNELTPGTVSHHKQWGTMIRSVNRHKWATN